MADSKLKQEEDNIVPAGEDNSKTDESESEKGGTAQEKTSEADAMEIAHTETLAPEATELTNNLTLKPELTTEDDAVAPNKESSPKDDSETVGRKDQVTDDQCQEGSPNGQTASGPKSVEDIDNRSKQEEDNKVPAGEDNSKTDDTGSEKRGTAQEMPLEPKAMETAHTPPAPEAKEMEPKMALTLETEVDHMMSLESNGSDTQDDTVPQDKVSSPKDGSGTVGSEDQVTADQCQEGSQIGLNQSQSSLGTESEKNTDNTRQLEECKLKLKEREGDITTLKAKLKNQKKEHDSILKQKEDKIHSLETDMGRQKEDHDSILKQKEDEIDSLGTKMRRHQEECELKLKQKEDDITTLEAKLRKTKEEHASVLKDKETEFNSLKTEMKSEESSYASAIQRQADTQIQLHSNMNDLNNFIKEQGSSITTLNYQLSEKAKIIQGNEKRIRELEIDSKMFQTAAEATKSSSVSRIASMQLEQTKALERARQDYWRKWEEMEIYHSQELMKRETNAAEIFEGCQREIDTQRKEKKAVEEKHKKEVESISKKKSDLESKFTKEVDKLKKEVETISKKKYDLESDLQQRKGTNKELERKNTDYWNALRIAGETNRKLSGQIEGQTKIYNAMTESYNLSQADANKIQQAKDSLEKYLQQREEMHRQEIANLNAEMRRLTLRLSKIASAKMTTGNSSIADLSDGFRPTKISELFSELYDNQWTDAFDQLPKESDREERDAILLLLEILQESYKTCVSTAQSHLQGVKDAMCNFRIQATQESVSQENDVTKVDLEVPDESWKMIMDFHKAAAYGSKGEIATSISSSQMENREFRNMDKVGDYMKTCADICWLMAVQDPPVVVDVLDVPPGCQKSFNKDRYRAYTRTGKFYDFTVWPALLLQKDGPILCKGVAQGK